MSAQINCDRCAKNTRGYFLNARLEIGKGVYASVSSKVSGLQLPWSKHWHLCETCYADLRRWSQPPPEAAS